MNMFPKRSEMSAPATPTEPAWRSEPASPEQFRTIASLRDTKDDTGMGPTPFDLTKGKASDAIEWLMKRPSKPITHRPDGDYLLGDLTYRLCTTQDGKRQYVKLVHPNGFTEYAPGLALKVIREGVQVITQPTPPAPTIPLLDEGFYEDRDGQIYRVVMSDYGRLYVLKLDLANAVPGEKLVWQPHVVTLRQLSDMEPTEITLESVRNIGAITLRCVFCGRTLSDDRSTARGYGPTCAEKHNLPWGD